MDSSTTIPAYLSTPPLTAVAPPVRTRAQKLPFGELAWEDFERLCLRLVRTEAEVLHCQLYGTPGQNQEGIDFYAKLVGGNDYCVYQCKRENNFSAAKIKKAVNRFLTGVWAKKARTLVLCTKESLIPTKRANEIEAQRQRLANEGITLFSWDSLQLSSRLKKHPELVDDFFGRAWVTAFCGEEVANGLGCRLDALDVIKFRKSLGVFYARVFAKHDPGLPLASLGHEGTLALRDRYVVPDILEFRSFTDTKPDKGKNALESDVLEPGDDPGPSRDIRPTIERTVETSRERTGVEAWLARSANLVVLGGPGSGKSSLLRFLAIDLLEDAPSLQALAERWGKLSTGLGAVPSMDTAHCEAHAGGRIALSMQDHGPYALAFNDLAFLTFIELVDEAARYQADLAFADDFRDTFDADEAEEESDDAAEETDAKADEEDASPEPACVRTLDIASPEPACVRTLDIALAAGYMLRTKANGWKLFCDRLNVPPFLVWEIHPGFDRLQLVLAMAEKAAFVPEGFLRWLNRVRPKGEPELTAVPLTVEGVADETEKTFRWRVQWWGG